MIWGAFILGLFSSLHCVGMCGPIALMLPVSRTSTFKKQAQLLSYHLGRLLTYTLMGLFFGTLGRGFFLAGIQQQLSIVLGIAMIVFSLFSSKMLGLQQFNGKLGRGISLIKKQLGQQIKSKKAFSFFVVGVLNGFLPCGLVYVALFGALGTQDYSEAAKFMFSYGLGTVPLMLLIKLLLDAMTPKVRGYIQKGIPVLTCLLGVFFVIRGLGLSIPYLSPSTLNLIIGAHSVCH
ncbi:MAG: sulfite exporter TauE/SafE family protein [Flavobacterium sp.]|nr:sulfite exporter TauE/SafE family protein [Candidatus Neoflavobacterium equi]